MNQVNATTWTHTMDILDGTQLQYKYTRGSWDVVESWGSIVNINNRSVTISYGADGTQLVDNTATDWSTGPDDEKAVRYWRDPIVVSHAPAADAVGLPLDTAVVVTWSIPMEPDTTFTVEGPDGPVAGNFTYDETAWLVSFTPDDGLDPGFTYQVTISGAVSVGIPGGDAGVQQTTVVYSFTTITINEQFTDLIKDVIDLWRDGTLNFKQAKSLISNLFRAMLKWNSGRPQGAANQLNVFIDRVEAYIDAGVLTPEVGQDLIDRASDLIGQITE
jgi:hypothetical protein